MIIPVSKPKACETAVTAIAWYLFDNLPPKKSAAPQSTEDKSANNEAISLAYYLDLIGFISDALAPALT